MKRKHRFHIVSVVLGTVLVAGCAPANDPIKLYNTGVEHYNGGEYAKAIGMFEWSLERGREFSPSLIGLAKCHLALAQHGLEEGNHLAAFTDLEHALNWINHAIDAAPGSTEAYRTKIAILTARGEVEATVATARQADALAGPSADTVIMLAQTHQTLGDYDGAELALKQGLKVAPKDVSLTIELAKLYDRLERYDLALEYYQQAYKIDPHYPDLLERIAWLRALASERESQTSQ